MNTDDTRTLDCPHRDACGACSLLGKPYREQLRLKRSWLMDALDGHVDYDRRQVLETLPSPEIEGYRSRAKMTISSDRDRVSSLGYFQRRSREVVDAPDCGVLVPELLDTTRRFRSLLNSRVEVPFRLRHVDLRCGTDPTHQHLTLVVKADQLPRLPVEEILDACGHVCGLAVNLNAQAGAQVIKGRIEPLVGDREVFVKVAGLRLRVSPGSFFQVNLGLLPEIHRLMAEFLGGGGLLLDLYAGVGTHGLALRDSFRRILCVEGVRSAVADAKATIQAARVSNVEIIGQPVRRALKRLRSERADAVILNPSRAGAEAAALDTVLASGARAVAYLSCDPTTLARDVKALTAGGFKLVSVQAVDMMPQTRQVEALALLRR